MILLDANIHVRMGNHDDPDYHRTLRVVFSERQSDVLVVSPQSLYEFWAVATRNPANNGLGMNGERASCWIRRYARLFRFVWEPPALFDTWSALVAAYDVRGFRAHDARHVAFMRAIGIEKILTYNTKHYTSFPVTIIAPSRC